MVRNSVQQNWCLDDPTPVRCLFTYCTFYFPGPEPASSPGSAELGTWMLLKGGEVEGEFGLVHHEVSCTLWPC